MTILPEQLRDQILRGGTAYEVPDLPAGVVGYVVAQNLDLPQGPRFGAVGIAYVESDPTRSQVIAQTDAYDYITYATDALQVAARRGIPAVVGALPEHIRRDPTLIDYILGREGSAIFNAERMAAEIAADVEAERARAAAEGRA
jgi:hypothetical protein